MRPRRSAVPVKRALSVLVGVMTLVSITYTSGARAAAEVRVRTAVFSAFQAATGYELWRTDGTRDGTNLLRDLKVGREGSRPVNLSRWKRQIFFGTRSGTWGLWRSDGTRTGTSLLKRQVFPGEFTPLASHMLFVGWTEDNGSELWRSDGTPTGTRLLKDIFPGINDTDSGSFARSSDPHFLTLAGRHVFFFAKTPVENGPAYVLWKSDGTTSGTTMVKDVRLLGWTSDVSPAAMDGHLFFTARTGSGYDYELWLSDGTTDGTVLVKDINPGPEGSGPRWLKPAGEVLYFFADDGETGNELWVSDGTSDGTRLVADINPGSAGSSPELDFEAPVPYAPRGIGGTLFFAADDGSNGVELWRSRGTVDSTTMVKNINPGSGSSHPKELVVIGDTLYFVADDGTSGSELWRSDGTRSGTRRVQDIAGGGASSDPSWLTRTSFGLMFVADDGKHGFELWRSDGTSRGTRLVRNIRPGGYSGKPRWLTSLS